MANFLVQISECGGLANFLAAVLFSLALAALRLCERGAVAFTEK
jgi:hypothetical protein